MLFKHLLKQLPAALVVAGLAIAGPVVAESSDANLAEHHHEPDVSAWLGTYNGSLPCADCIGVKTTLALNKNSTYLMITQYLGKSEREYTEKGKLSWVDAHTLLLTSRDGNAKRYYQLGNNALTQLDDNAKLITGKQAERYTLRRQDITANPPSHSSHH